MISDRVAVKELLITTLEAAFAATSGDDPDLTGVRVFYDDPGENITDEFVSFGEVTGTLDTVAFGPQSNDDVFLIKCVVGTDRHATSVIADRRCQQILSAMNVALFTSGPGTNRIGRTLGAVIYPGKQDGPNADPPLNGNPAASTIELDVAVTIAVRGA